jgi:hypothetical protein
MRFHPPTAESAMASSMRTIGILTKLRAASVASPIEEQVVKMKSAPASSAAK